MNDFTLDDATFTPSPARFIVGLGASAGGIEALKAFFTNVARDGVAAYVVVLHLSPEHDSQLAAVLQTSAPIPVTQVTNRTAIEPDHVYVVPPNRLLTIEEDTLQLSEFTKSEHRRAPVDLFFRSLADAQGSRAVCVILSGTGPNGSSGLRRIKEYGGLVIAQQPDEAQYKDMPRNAIATGLVDVVLPVASMPARIREYHDRLKQGDELRTAAVPGLSDPEAMRDILTMLRVRTGHDFSNYKPATIQRRVERRIHLRNLQGLPAYARAIREYPDEAMALMKELLISVTNFFRDPTAWDTLAARVIPRIFLNKGAQDQVRVWVPACATGEEAYSIAMLLAEHAAAAIEQPGVQIFATDLDEGAIAIARDAVYTDADVADVSEERLKRFFTRESGGYRIRRELRETVLFAHHNVLKDPPFSHLDLVCCRNLLIYLTRSVQERLVENFHFALRPGAYLFLGGSESPDSSQDLFTAFDKSAHIYESRTVTSRVSLLDEQTFAVPRPILRQVDVKSTDRISAGELHQRLLERYAPPSIVVTEEHTVVHLSDQAGRFLRVAGGELTRDLLKMIRDDLRPDVRTALHQATRERRTVEVKGVTAMLDDGPQTVDVTVHPVFRDTDPARGYLLITFDERTSAAAQKEQDAPKRLDPALADVTNDLEEEVNRLKLQLRTTIEQYETQVEEAKASNEELQAMNEELRSAAEELETSKEELQSVNEELTSVNQELKVKIEELKLTNNDFQNLMNSSDIGTIFLDRNLLVKLATPAASQVFNLQRSDVGRPLSDITSTLVYDDLHRDIQRVLASLQTLDRETRTRDQRWVSTRLKPYRTTDDRIEGIVITLQDVTERRRAEEQLRQGEERLRLLIDSAIDYAIFTMTTAGVIDSWNPGAERMFGYAANAIIGRHFEVLFTADDRAAGVPARELQDAQATGRSGDERFHVRKDGSRFFCSGATTRLGEALGFAKIARDLSTQQQAAEALRVVQAEFDAQMRARTDELEAEVVAGTAAHARVSDLLKRIITAQEDERARIARDLHDQLGQELTVLPLNLQRLAERRQEEEIEQALAITHEIDRDIDFLSWQLRPAVLDDVGLAAALPLFVREWSTLYRVEAEYRGVDPGDRLGRDAEVVFYRVAQEALNNVAKHAHASRVDVLLEGRDGSVVMVVEDNGVGFDLGDRQRRDKGIGILGMEERASVIGADLEIESTIGKGTSVYLRMPVTGEHSSEDP